MNLNFGRMDVGLWLSETLEDQSEFGRNQTDTRVDSGYHFILDKLLQPCSLGSKTCHRIILALVIAGRDYIYNPAGGNIYLVYKSHILPIGWLHTTYHPLQEPEKSVELLKKLLKENNLHLVSLPPSWLRIVRQINKDYPLYRSVRTKHV